MATVKLNAGGKVLTKQGKVSCECCATPFGLLASATSAGGNQGCAMGPAVQTYFINPPYTLIKNKQYRLKISFTSGDSLFHVSSFYEANYTFNPDMNVSWTTTHTGTFGNPWTISNGGKTIRYSLEDSVNCKGSNSSTQTGIATAIIINPTSKIIMGFSFTGIAELQDSGFENIQFYLEDV